MRNKILAAIAGSALLLSGFLAGLGSTATAQTPKISNAQYVKAYNDGFMDGSCKEYDGIKVDGWGNYCKTAGIHK
jgi:hypothetical protein